MKTFKKDNSVKYLSDESKLINILLKDGWTEEVEIEELKIDQKKLAKGTKDGKIITA